MGLFSHGFILISSFTLLSGSATKSGAFIMRLVIRLSANIRGPG
jgi:hypothetical protein